jgi:ankyrin repeat protein
MKEIQRWRAALLRPAVAAAAMILLSACAARRVGDRTAEAQRSLNRALVVASFQGDAAEVRRLLAAGAWGDARYGPSDHDHQRAVFGMALAGMEQWAPLHAAACGKDPAGRVEVARALLDAGAGLDPDDGYGATPLYMAIDGGDEVLALLLIGRGAEVNTETRTYIDDGGGTPLVKAAWRRNATLVKALLDRGAYPEDREHSPLHAAAGAGCLECARLLIAAGADVNAGCEYDKTLTPLLVAAARRQDPTSAMVKLLVEAGADVNARLVTNHAEMVGDEDQWEVRTPLHYETAHADVEAAGVLIAAGADVNAVNEAGDTPLHLVAESVFEKDPAAAVELAARLVRAGADVAARNVAGKTPADLLPTEADAGPPGESALEARRRLKAILRGTEPAAIVHPPPCA